MRTPASLDECVASVTAADVTDSLGPSSVYVCFATGAFDLPQFERLCGSDMLLIDGLSSQAPDALKRSCLQPAII